MNRALKVIGATVAGIAVLVGLWYGGWALRQANVNRQRQVVQHSLPYVEAKQSLLMQLAAEYNRTQDAGTKQLIVNRMRLESGRLVADQIPTDVLQIMGRHR